MMQPFIRLGVAQRLLAIVFGASVLMACSSSEEAADSAGNAQVLRLSLGTSPQTLDPHQMTGVPAHKVANALTEPLMITNYRTMEFKPGVAESWEMLDDGLRYRFKLRENAKWSNGEPITSQDFVYSWQRMLSPGLGNQYAMDYYAIKNASAFHSGELEDFGQVGVKAINDRELEFILSSHDPLFLNRLADEKTAPVHKATVEQHGAMDDPTNPWIRAENHVGNGPFVLKKWEIGQTIVVEKNPHYWGAEDVKLEEIHFNPAESEAVEERLYRAGQIDMTFGGRLPVDKFDDYRANMPNEFVSQPTYATYFYLYNVTQPPFDNLNVRKAFALAIDKSLLTRRITKNDEPVALSLSPETPGYQAPQMPEYDPELARKYLADAGYPGGEGFPDVTLAYNTSDMHRKIAIAIQQMWKTVLNVDVEMENQEWKVFLNSRQNLEHDIARAGSVSTFVDPIDFLTSYTTGHGMNDTGWSNEQYDKVVRQSDSILDVDQRFAKLAEAEAILLEELPLIPLYHYTESYLISPKVKGFQFNQVGLPNFRDVYIDHNEEQ